LEGVEKEKKNEGKLSVGKKRKRKKEREIFFGGKQRFIQSES
jgi:hypothetical protein